MPSRSVGPQHSLSPWGAREVALRRWFSWTYAYERFDEQWTAARVVTRWLVEVLGHWVEAEEARFACENATAHEY